LTWKSIVEKSAAEANAEPAFVTSALKHLDDMDRYCRGAACRHRALVNYFGQEFANPSCDACDLCLGDVATIPDAAVIAQKSLSGVARTGERFGAAYVSSALRGEDNATVRQRGHEGLSVFGILKDVDKSSLRDWIYQLIGQGVLAQEDLELSNGARV